MAEPVLDLSEIVDLYKEDARRMILSMRAALERWTEVSDGGPACLELRKYSHQLRGSGRTYGFRDVTRVAKAMEHLTEGLQKHALPADERMRRSILGPDAPVFGVVRVRA